MIHDDAAIFGDIIIWKSLIIAISGILWKSQLFLTALVETAV